MTNNTPASEVPWTKEHQRTLRWGVTSLEFKCGCCECWHDFAHAVNLKSGEHYTCKNCAKELLAELEKVQTP